MRFRLRDIVRGQIRTTGWLMASSAAAAGLSYVSVSLTARLLGVDDFGLLSAVLGFGSVLILALTPLYNLANVVDDFDFKITHVIRGIEHLANTPRQIFIAQGLGYPLPEYAHIPYVAAPGSKEKLSKRKLANYFKNAEFKSLYDRGFSLLV